MNKQQVIDFLTTDFSLANLPDSFMQLRRIANDPHSDIADVVEVVRKDTELAASLLKLSNSSIYNNGSEQVGTIEEAAQLLGLRKVVESSLALGIIQEVKIDSEQFDLRCYWKRSLSVATIAEDVYLAAPRYLKTIIDPKMLYTAGLLHDIGMLALIQGFTDEMARIVDLAVCQGLPIQEVEQREFGFTHQDVGRILFKKWNLPEELQSVAGYHHNPIELRRRLLYPLVDLVYISDYICSVCSDHTASAFKPKMYEEVWKRSGISLSLIEDFADRMDEVYASTNAILTC
ncbi:HDOD domain-containing protein [Pelagicoccus sp. SDUM812002]|uniref:HDOD domain-containing protein n=1 Tax=Pelagicoccus sp. SDUM812002 TaxID=3041266 RepID=UPI00280F3EAA|nr:HDOD domain-containing protein [Pelagicoccus sp. SDUM812002]MDQ8188273.1 HDOD domain-containing protein [Pelagicoccus sp. SDUM812002]